MAIKRQSKDTNELKYEIKEECGSIKRANGNTVKLRYMSWDDQEECYDLRIWWIDKAGKEHPGKGFCLTGEELLELRDLITKLEQED